MTNGVYVKIIIVFYAIVAIGVLAMLVVFVVGMIMSVFESDPSRDKTRGFDVVDLNQDDKQEAK